MVSSSPLYFFQGSKTLLALLVPICALGHGAFLVSITLILMSTIFLLSFCKQKPNLVIKEAHISKIDFSPQDNTLISCADSDPVPIVEEAQTGMKKQEDVQDQFLIASQDLYSESESMDQFSTTSSSEEDHSSDIEWPYNMGQRLDCSDDSISDEESLIEIAIPTGQFVSADKRGFKCCKLSHQKDFWADMYDMNEEDNLIEIDIYMGSIKCSSFEL